jgi:hypothetical protein
MPIDRPSAQLPTEIAPADRLLTAAEFHRLADVPPEVEWFAGAKRIRARSEQSVTRYQKLLSLAAGRAPGEAVRSFWEWELG